MLVDLVLVLLVMMVKLLVVVVVLVLVVQVCCCACVARPQGAEDRVLGGSNWVLLGAGRTRVDRRPAGRALSGCRWCSGGSICYRGRHTCIGGRLSIGRVLHVMGVGMVVAKHGGGRGLVVVGAGVVLVGSRVVMSGGRNCMMVVVVMVVVVRMVRVRVVVARDGRRHSRRGDHRGRGRRVMMGSGHGSRLIVVGSYGGARRGRLVGVPRLVLPGGLVVGAIENPEGVVDSTVLRVGGGGGQRGGPIGGHGSGGARLGATRPVLCRARNGGGRCGDRRRGGRRGGGRGKGGVGGLYRLGRILVRLARRDGKLVVV